MVKNENFYVTHGWMINELGLSGVELDVYAIIYGFSQDGSSEFTGTTKYLIDWTGRTKKTVITALNSLTERGLIIKREINIAEHLKMVAYKTAPVSGVKITPPEQKLDGGQCKNYTGGGVKTTPNNINNNSIDNYKYIVEYLNRKAGTNYKPSTPKTRKLIDARLKEGFTVDDFIKVIDNKVSEWSGTEIAQYIRPVTLFGDKFESYLNQKPTTKKAAGTKFSNFNQPSSTNWDELESKLFQM